MATLSEAVEQVEYHDRFFCLAYATSWICAHTETVSLNMTDRPIHATAPRIPAVDGVTRLGKPSRLT